MAALEGFDAEAEAEVEDEDGFLLDVRLPGHFEIMLAFEETGGLLQEQRASAQKCLQTVRAGYGAASKPSPDLHSMFRLQINSLTA